jgi:hypothetical protein
MSTITIVTLRVRSALPVLGALALITLVAIIALGTTAGSIRNGVAAGARVALANAAAQSAAVQISTHLAGDPATQAAAAAAAIDRMLPAGTVSVTSWVRSNAVPVLAGVPDAPGSRALFARIPDLSDRVEITAGSWPAEGTTAAAPVAVQADAAAALGLDVGDELTVGSTATPVDLQVAALWRASDPTASAWFADSAALAGGAGGAVGLFVLDGALTALPTQLFAVWTLSATPAAASDTNRAAVISGLDRLTDTVDAIPDVTDTSSSVEGELAGTLQRIDDAGRGATAIGISAVFIVGMLTIVALLQVSAVLVGSRRASSALLRARGLSRAQSALLAVTEALLVTVPAGLAGLAGTAGILSVITGTAALGHAQFVLPYALGVGLVSVLLLTVAVLSEPVGQGQSSRRPLAIFAVAFGTIGVAAGIALWQLHAQGSPVPAGSAAGADLVTAASPALALVTVAALGTSTFIWAAAGLSARSVRRGSVVAVLADRQLGVRATAHLVPILAVAVTIASAAFATGIATTWQSAQLQAHLVGTGPDIGIALRSDSTATADTEPVAATGYAALDGVRGASAALVTRVRVGADSIPFVSLRPDAAANLLGAAGDPLAKALRGTSPTGSGLAMPETATGVEATVSFGAAVPAATFAVSVWVADADGSLAHVPLAAANAGSATGRAVGVRAGALPAGTAPWRLLAVEAERIGTPDTAVPTLLVGGFASTADGTPTALEPGAEVSLDIAAALPRSRALISTDAPAAPLPVVVTSARAGRVDLAVGDPLDLGFGTSGATVTARVSSIIETLPGAASRLGIATDLAALNDATLQQGRVPQLAGNVWLDTGGADSPATDSVAVAASRVSGSTAVISSERTETSAPILEPAMNAFWIAAAAAGLLALITLAAFITDDSRSRRSALPVLRALGLSAAQQTAVRARELLIILGFAVLVGIVAGPLATTAAVAPFVAAAIPGAGGYVSVAPAFDLLRWLLFSTGIVAGALLVIGGSLRRLHRGLRQVTVPIGPQRPGPDPARTDPVVIS